MKSWFKFGLQMFLGGLVGYTFMYVYLNNEIIQIDLTNLVLPFTWLLLLLLLGLTAWGASRVQRIRRLTKQPLTGDEEDEAEGYMYQAYSDGSLASTLTVILSLTSASFILLTGQSLAFLIAILLSLVAGIVLSYSLNRLLAVMYPERALPKLSDPDYAQRLLDLSDDGEKHVMLQGLYKTNLSTTSLMTLAIILLLVYSVLTGDSQLFSIFVVSLIMVFTNIQYIRIIRSKN
ncbi:DUF3169 family protein [Exiguobacterium sp. s150]|uniref:DUF3169 family protein n=1 Tax=Exiguobacterium sp. s150 TaxID=2751221 RepID=UPI001BECD6E0|nr:DUF3169 family protein [Exiguobacterium sp. s150]